MSMLPCRHIENCEQCRRELDYRNTRPASAPVAGTIRTDNSAVIAALEARCAELERERDRFGETLDQAYDLMDERKWGEAMDLVSRAMHYPKPTDAPTDSTKLGERPWKLDSVSVKPTDAPFVCAETGSRNCPIHGKDAPVCEACAWELGTFTPSKEPHTCNGTGRKP